MKETEAKTKTQVISDNYIKSLVNSNKSAIYARGDAVNANEAKKLALLSKINDMLEDKKDIFLKMSKTKQVEVITTLSFVSKFTNVITNDFYLVPYKNTGLEIQLSYNLLLKMVRGSNDIKVLRAEVVKENDDFEMNLAFDNPLVRFCPNLTGNRGDVLGAFAIAKIGNEIVFRFMTKEDLLVVKNKSQKSKLDGKFSPAWRDFEDEMFRKVVLRKLIRELNLLNDDVAEMIQLDDRNTDLETPHKTDYNPNFEEVKGE